jgi:hypothetical protein
LGLITKLDDHRRHHVYAECHRAGRRCGSTFLIENVFLHDRPTGAAMLHRPAHRIPALLVEEFVPALMVFI